MSQKFTFQGQNLSELIKNLVFYLKMCQTFACQGQNFGFQGQN